MACYHPLKAFQIGYHIKTGKPKYKICSYDTEYIQFSPIENRWKTHKKPFNASLYNEAYINNYIVFEFKEIPCGKCIQCRLKYSRDWATRCMLEAKYHEDNYFLTLTYNDDAIKEVERDYIDDNTGEIKTTHSLCKRDFQLFMKRLRKNYPHDNKIRFFACGEYGDKTARPHYHAIVFGLKLDDLKLYRQSRTGFNYYTSDFLNKCWYYRDKKTGEKYNKGFIIIADVTWDSCAYVARYVMKKQSGKNKDVYDRFNIDAEFSLMSRKPGIAKEYWEDNFKEIYKYDELIYSTKEGGHKSKPPRYFDKLFEEECPELYEELKERREEIAKCLKEEKLKNTSLSYPELLEIEENNKKAQIKALRRIL